MDIVVGRVYRAKKPSRAGGLFTPYYNDRVVLFVSDDIVQYDGPAVAFGRHHPKVSREKFEKWAGEDVTDRLPKGEWEEHK